MLDRLEQLSLSTLRIIMAAVLAAMALMVFGNVVMRYFFNSGINISAELSRFLFIWMTFLGAIVVMHENGHLGVDSFVRLMSHKTQRIAITLSYLLMMMICVMLLWGLVLQHPTNLGRRGMITGISMEIVYAPAYLCAVVIFIILLVRLLKFWRGQLNPDQMLSGGDAEVQLLGEDK